MNGCFWSQHPACLRVHILSNNTHFGTLAGGLGSFPFDAPTYLVQSDSHTPSVRHSEFDILGRLWTPFAKFSALPPADLYEVPKAGRENQLSPGSIEFLRYPHLIPLFNGCGFGPPSPFTAASNLDMDRSPGFGPEHVPLKTPLRLGFPAAPHLKCLTLPVPAARRTVLQYAVTSKYFHSL